MSLLFACINIQQLRVELLIFAMSLLFACLIHTSTKPWHVIVCVAFACHCFMAKHLLHQERCSM